MELKYQSKFYTYAICISDYHPITNFRDPFAKNIVRHSHFKYRKFGIYRYNKHKKHNYIRVHAREATFVVHIKEFNNNFIKLEKL